MSYNNKGQKHDANGWKIDQYYNPVTDAYEPLEGSNGAQKVQSSATKAVSVTTSDTTDLADGVTKGLYLGTSGNVAVIMSNGSEVTFNNLAAGMIHPISVKRIKTTGTGASLNILAIY